MNVAALARKLNVSTEILREKLPELGFDIGGRALKIDERVAEQIIKKWQEYKRLEREKARWQTRLGTKEEKPKEIPTEAQDIKLPPKLTVREFAHKLQKPVATIIRELMNNGILATLNDYIDFETAAIIAEDLGFKILLEEVIEKELALPKEEILSVGEPLTPRPPVVVIMGHVDHGKSKLLETMRQVEMLSKEAGGITQHIGAYQVTVPLKIDDRLEIPRQARDDLAPMRTVTFIDTPGHEAFTTMRSRGARVADIAILVVAVDDGVQPQTREALKIIQAAKLPFIVAINKIDKPDVNLDLLKSQLAELGLTPEEWGGKTIMVQISAKTGKNIDQLLDTILLIYELEKEKIAANPHRRAVGTIIESHTDPAQGNSVTVLVQNGTLRTGDYVSHGNVLLGKVRAMRDWNGQVTGEALPSTPVKILGFRVLPDVGDIITVPENIEILERKTRIVKKITHAAPVSLPRTTTDGKILLNVIVKADVLGSLEALVSSLEKLGTNIMNVKIISQGLGNVIENDVNHAAAGNAKIYGFNVVALPDIQNLAFEKKIDIKLFQIIYDLIDAVKKDLDTLVPEEIVWTYLGKLKVKAIFRTEKDLQIVGGVVTDGKLRPGSKFRIMRVGSQIGEGKIDELQSGKRPANEIPAGSECGLKARTRTKMLVEDELEIYVEEKRKITI